MIARNTQSVLASQMWPCPVESSAGRIVLRPPFRWSSASTAESFDMPKLKRDSHRMRPSDIFGATVQHTSSLESQCSAITHFRLDMFGSMGPVWVGWHFHFPSFSLYVLVRVDFAVQLSWLGHWFGSRLLHTPCNRAFEFAMHLRVPWARGVFFKSFRSHHGLCQSSPVSEQVY